MTDFSRDVIAFSELIGIQFTEILLLEQALTHRSYVNENKRHNKKLQDNERLEFLGDAVIDYIAGDWLYQQFPKMREGQLTRLRAALVCTEMLAEFALTCGIDAVIRLGIGEEANDGRHRNSILCDAFEAVIGAIYLDRGEAVVRKFIKPLFEPALKAALQRVSTKDNKSRLQEWFQAQPERLTPTYHTLAAPLGPDHAKEFIVEVRIEDLAIGWGCGRSKRKAEQAAAQMAIELLIPNEAETQNQ